MPAPLKKGYYRFFSPHSLYNQQAANAASTTDTSPPRSRNFDNNRRNNNYYYGKKNQNEAFKKQNRQFKLAKNEKERLKLGNKAIVSVGFVGMDENSLNIVNQILEKPTFSLDTMMETLQSEIERGIVDVESFPIDTYHEVETGAVYMYLSSAMDNSAVISKAEKRNEAKQDLTQQLDERELQLTKSLLFMFHVCHIILFVLPGRQFDLRFLRLFRILQLAKQHMNSVFLSHLGSSSYTSELNYSSLYSPGRVLPVIGFIFCQSNQDKQAIKRAFPGEEAKVMDKMQQALEAQVRSIIRRGKFAGTDNTRTPLFMVDPTRCTFIVSESNDTLNSLDALRQCLLNMDAPTSPKPSKPSTPTRKSRDVSSTGVEIIKDFLDRQYDYFSRQRETGKRFLLPSSYNWFHAAYAFEELLAVNASKLEMDKIKILLNPDWQFSENRCTQAFAFVKDQFIKRHASFESCKSEEEVIQAALFTFDAYACGPLQDHYKEKLTKEISDLWNKKSLSKADTKPEEAAAKLESPKAESATKESSVETGEASIQEPKQIVEKQPSIKSLFYLAEVRQAQTSQTQEKVFVSLPGTAVSGPASLISDALVQVMGPPSTYNPDTGFQDAAYIAGGNFLCYYDASVPSPFSQVTEATRSTKNPLSELFSILRASGITNQSSLSLENAVADAGEKEKNDESEEEEAEEIKSKTPPEYRSKSKKKLGGKQKSKESKFFDPSASPQKPFDTKIKQINPFICPPPSSAPSNSKKHRIYIGFEYETGFERKFVLAPQMLTKHYQKTHYNRSSQSSGSVPAPQHKLDGGFLLQTDIPIFFHWPTHVFGAAQSYKKQQLPVPQVPQESSKRTLEMSKLKRIVVITPDTDVPMTLNPKLQLDTEEGDLQYVYDLGGTMTILPRNSYCSISLNYVPEYEKMTSEQQLKLKFTLQNNMVQFQLQKPTV